MSRWSDERGVTLIELLIGATLMLLITGATLTLLEASMRQSGIVQTHNDSQQQARTALDQMARDLRNLSAPASLAAPSGIGCHGARAGAVARNLPYDLVYCAVSEIRPAGSANAANVKRVRYCLDSTDPSRAVLWQQSQRWTSATAPAMPADTACPGATGAGAWDSGRNRVVSSSVVNVAGGLQRPVFRYAGDAGAITATDDDSRARITRLRADLHVDPDPATRPQAAHLATAVFLRNQNREPSASFTIDVLNPATPLIELNATASQDPEGQRLRFQFYIDPPSPLPDCTVATPHASCVLPASPRVQLVPPLGIHDYVLQVSDPANLRGTQTRRFP